MTPSPHDDDLREETALPDASDLQLVDLDSQLNRRRSPRQKLISVSVLAAFLVLATLVSLRYSHTLLGATPTATPTRHFVSSDHQLLPQQVAVLTNVSSAIMLNGAPVSSTAPTPYTIVTLITGKNILSISAPPLAPRSCIISYPANVRIDTCEQINDAVGATLIDLTLGWNALTSAQQQAVIAVVNTYIGHLDNPMWHTAIPVGQYYVSGYDPQTGLPLAKVATTTVNAALTTSMASPNANGSFADCQYIICPPQYFAPVDPVTPATLHWLIQVHAALTWKFAAATSGTSIAVPAIPPVTFSTQTSSVLFTDMQTLGLVLTYAPATGWSIVNEDTLGLAQVFETICAVGNQFVATVAAAQNLYPIEASSTAQPTLEGCRLNYTLTNSGNTYSPQFIYRFGVLFAGNDDAHQLFPTLSVASVAENAAVPNA